MFVDMFRGRPSLAAELLDGPLHDHLPDYDEVHLASADLADVVPTEYRADVVVTLTHEGSTVLAVVVEVQRRIDTRKLLSWPAYVATLYARLNCPVTLLVYCPQRSVVGWAAKPIVFGFPAGHISPVAVGPDQLPVITDPEIARRLPELTVMSAIAHATHPDPAPLLEALLMAYRAVEVDRAALYHDLVLMALPNQTRKMLEDLMTATNYTPRSDFAKHHFAQGKMEGLAKGLAEAKGQDLLTVLESRGLTVSDEARTTIVECSDLDQLDRWMRQVATVERVEDLGGPLAV
ncbi:hypothetical protein [Actinoplanes utahensis]|uniref:hypothetical protein n=1 Tax=Actinoplanes utahensis TaxID=1869 RepID=UPI000B251AF6